MIFEIDVSGEDIFSKDYTIVVADKNNLIKGFKFDSTLSRTIREMHGKGVYRYPQTHKGKALFKVRLYCIIIYYLFKNIKIANKNQDIDIEICRDFQGHERDISSTLIHFLKKLLGLNISIKYTKLPKDSNADKYAYLMRKDVKNKMEGYIKITLEDIERYLIK